MAKQDKREGFEVTVVANGYVVRECRDGDRFRSIDSAYVFESFDGLSAFLRRELREPAE